MAVVKVVLFNICFLYISNVIILSVSALDLSIPTVFAYEGHQLPNEELLRNHYRLYKREAPSPPIKKAFISSEKKLLTKFTTVSNVHLKMLEYEANNSTANVTEVTTAVSTANTTLASNVSSVSLETNSTPATVNATSAGFVSSSFSTSSNTSLPGVTTPMDVLPTKPASITNTTEDHHVYYNSSLFLEKEKAVSFWVDFDSLPQDKVTVHRMLSDSHRKAATVGLTFDFPFYGHPLRNITIATGGFIYMGDYMHSWLAATQYIAPLMANFDTSLSNDSTVRYFDNGTAFIIEWHQVSLQDDKREGNFTFQATLLKNGNIIFVYKIIPVSVTEIGDEAHPVKVGLSDAYVIDRVIYFIRRKTIYEYHRIDMKKEEIGNDTAILFTALRTCINYQDCSSCMTAASGLDCVWCESAKRCSDGLDRNRQDWLDSKCNVEREAINCSSLPSPNLNPFVQPLTDSPPKVRTFPPHTLDIQDPTTYPHYQPSYRDGSSSSARVSEESSSVSVGSMVVILLILAVVLGGLVWVGYAYRNPHTSSGQLLIRYRPTQWRFRNGEARYTAASVHM